MAKIELELPNLQNLFRFKPNKELLVVFTVFLSCVVVNAVADLFKRTLFFALSRHYGFRHMYIFPTLVCRNKK